jgi:cytoskeletal protein CcmA (bactofilin family)
MVANTEKMSTTPNANSKNVLNSDVELTGSLKFAGELTFDGKLDGDISSEGVLNLGDNAVIRGNLNVNSVVVRGKVNGNVAAREKIEIKAKAELFGDIRAPKLVIEEGVTFVGKSEVNPNKATPTAPPTPRPGEAAKAPEPLIPQPRK